QQLSVSFWPLRLNNLKAETLKEMLDNSGIQNRVIVVSACYSGGFLDVLKDDNSLIITASSRDHVSYGCGDATQYTYFGESYFVQSLAHGNSFIRAFSDAQKRIAAREKSEGKGSSAPQIHIGKNIEEKLDLLPVKPFEACPPREICTQQ
ncbi:MAG: C13 family peptidase, partial [Gallionella sp.]